MKRENVIQEKSFEFSLTIIELYKKLVSEREYIISKQILRSGTSIGANIEEAIAAHSRKDFIYKMNLSRKEARETYYWLRLLSVSKLTKINLKTEMDAILEIIRILTSIVKSTSELNS